MKIFTVCLLLSSGLALASCNENNASNQERALVTDSIAPKDGPQSQLAFPLPDIPSDITEPSERAQYLVEHFWDKFDFSDDSYLNKPEALETSFANFVGIAVQFVPQSSDGDIAVPVQRADKKMLQFFLALYEKYLFDPRSPMVNDELYIPVLNAALKSSKLDYASEVRLKDRLEMLKKNRVGQPASDFVYELPDGSKHRLHSNFAPKTLLLFYSSSCHSCEELIKTIKSDKDLESMVQSKQLLLLMIDSESPSREQWLKSLDQMPDFARVGYDTDNSINRTRLYEFKSIPSIYLLGSSNKVILRGVSYERVKSYLNARTEKLAN